MEFIKQALSWIPEIAASAIIIVAGGGYIIRLFNKDTTQDKNEVVNSANTKMDFWKNQAEQYKVISDEKDKTYNEKITSLTKSFNDQIAALSREVGELKGQLTSETAQKKEYLAILQDKNPETKAFMDFMVKAVKNHDEAHEEMMRVLGEIHTMTQEEKDRELKVVSTVSKDGHV